MKSGVSVPIELSRPVGRGEPPFRLDQLHAIAEGRKTMERRNLLTKLISEIFRVCSSFRETRTINSWLHNATNLPEFAESECLKNDDLPTLPLFSHAYETMTLHHKTQNDLRKQTITSRACCSGKPRPATDGIL